MKRHWMLLAVAVGLFATPAVLAEEFETPEYIDPGMHQRVSLTHDQPFVVLFQIGIDSQFSISANYPVVVSQQEGTDHVGAVEFETPWDFESDLDELFLRAIFLDLVTEKVKETETRRIEVGKGTRVYESVHADGLFCIEYEFHRPVEDWKHEDGETGYTGTGYYIWRGGNHYNDKNHGRMDYEIDVDVAGEYVLLLHTHHWGGHENNDVWVRVDNNDWLKVYSSTDGRWDWHTQVDPGHKSFRVDLSAGRHSVQFAARSQKLRIDRFHLYHAENFKKGEIEDLTLPISGHYYE